MFAVEELLVTGEGNFITPILYGTTDPVESVAIFPRLAVLKAHFATTDTLNDFHRVLRQRQTRGQTCSIQEFRVYDLRRLDKQAVDQFRDIIPLVTHYEDFIAADLM